MCNLPLGQQHNYKQICSPVIITVLCVTIKLRAKFIFPKIKYLMFVTLKRHQGKKKRTVTVITAMAIHSLLAGPHIPENNFSSRHYF